MLRQISTKKVHVAKWLPVLVLGAVLALMWFAELAKEMPDLKTTLLVSAVGVAVLLWVQVRGPWRHLDKVEDGGDFLVLSKGRKEDRVLLANISDMSAYSDYGATTIVLHLSVPCEFGQRVSFMVDAVGATQDVSRLVEELGAKIRRAQRGVA